MFQRDFPSEFKIMFSHRKFGCKGGNFFLKIRAVLPIKNPLLPWYAFFHEFSYTDTINWDQIKYTIW